ncbi:3-phosphoshikimate 1-carboxyvinyltransferase [Sphingomicrobium clamense]|uniref:3-phosphoshikimate 1-carboxyvinyltransferase n=1 Tax=Sphingomicrobium clamense TaxID=2851013 RepID=A0ABS6V2K2_9SPHN|nr:3-phosphoshikimate 1-carboxyvinyltransferase [Sphingomicrobium sp. B8]MBW0143793.1 3-phosphoshikimate 1-carboxyvinyltransferase [Sphingomicrobium sp. B8]
MSAMRGAASPEYGGTASVPGDKSIAHRALILAALAQGTSRISRLPSGEDVASTRKAVEALGATVEADGDDWLVTGCEWTSPPGDIDCGNSGTSARLLMGAAAGFEGLKATFVGDESLSRRPMRRVIDPLSRMGASFDGGDTLPITLTGATLGGIDFLQPVASAQVKTAILLAGLRSSGPVRVVEPFASRDHSEVMLAQFGVEGSVEEIVDGHAVSLGDARALTATDVIVSGDPSSAAFLFAGAAITGGTVTVTDLNVNATRTGFLEALDAMGCTVEFANPRDWAGEPVADVTVSRTRTLQPIEWHRDKVPATIDELPLLAIVAAFADGESLLEGLGELRVKESDRLGAVIAGLAANGVSVFPDGDDLRVLGRGAVRGGGRIMVGHDHRIAMAFLTMGLGTKQAITVDDITPIATSFPDFVEVMRSLGANLEDAL